MIFKKIKLLKYQTFIKAYINIPNKRKRNFQRFWKKSYTAKMRKKNIIVFRTTLCTQKIKFCMQKKVFRIVCLRIKFDLQLKKKTKKKFWGVSSFFVSPSKKFPVIQIPYTGIVWFAFFSKKTSVFSSPDCFIRIKQPQKEVYIFFQRFLEIVWKLYEKHFSTHLMYEIVWKVFSVYGGQPGGAVKTTKKYIKKKQKEIFFF